MTHGFTESATDPIAVFTANLGSQADILPACHALFAALDPRPSRGFFGAITRLNQYLLSHQGPWLMTPAESAARAHHWADPQVQAVPSRFPRIHEPFLSEHAFDSFVTAYATAYPKADPVQRQEFIDIISGLIRPVSRRHVMRSAFLARRDALKEAEVPSRPNRQRPR